jgi:hypothetical protein
MSANGLGLPLTLVIFKRLFWVGAIVATWQFVGCSKISELSDPTASFNETVASQINHRKIFLHSVIPGGVFSADELARARRTDPVVALHYADFGSDTHVERLTKDELVYVSYRKADKVFWTQKKHRVCEGEAVITDGKNMARSRCGNRLSKTPQSPTAKNEPSESALNTAPVNPGGPVQTGAGPVQEASNLPNPSFVPDNLASNSNPHMSNGPAGTVVAPASTGAGPGGMPSANAFYPSPTPYYSGGPLAGARSSKTSSGGSTGTPTSPGGTTTPVVTPGGTTTPITETPEPGTMLLCVGGLLVLCFRRRIAVGLRGYSKG